nr:NADH dehydrogenase subunit 6 [Pennella sp. (in: crustaceans)]
MIFSLTISIMTFIVIMTMTISSPFLMNLTSILLMLSVTINLSFWNHIWLSCSIFIAFLGGMMVLFSYTTSLVKSEKTIKVSLNTFVLLALFLMPLFVSMMSMNTKDTVMSKFFLYKMNSAILFLSIFIILSMVTNVKMIEMKKGTIKHY